MEFEEYPLLGSSPRQAMERLFHAFEHYRLQHRLSAEIGIFHHPRPDQVLGTARIFAAWMFNAQNEEEEQAEAAHVIMYAIMLSQHADRIALVRLNANNRNR